MTNNGNGLLRWSAMVSRPELRSRKRTQTKGWFLVVASAVFLPRLLLSPECFTAAMADLSKLSDCTSDDADDQCDSSLQCIDGRCINPFTIGGCLRAKGKSTRIRVCNSQDPEEVRERGFCRAPYEGLEYMEVRIFAQNWEAGVFEAWLLQILLSEILDVPTSIETGQKNSEMNFYLPDSPFQFGEATDWEALRRATEYGDCRKLSGRPDYQSCAHVIPEVWIHGHLDTMREFEEKELIEAPMALGVLGQQNWYIPKFTAEADPTLMSFHGLAGEENRNKLAKTFLRPTTWQDYCSFVSPHNCTKDDGIAKRAPEESEYDRMFVEGLYTGYFRATEKNNCDTNPNCTGHIADYPCGWSSYLAPQTYHNKIALESDGKEPSTNGYTYTQISEMWAAAKATKSNLITVWWQPERTYQNFLRTDAELQTVFLEPPTQDCLDNRIAEADRCSDGFEARVGKPEGACGEATHPLQKVVALGLSEEINDPLILDEVRSPALEAIRRFTVSELDFGVFAEKWLNSLDNDPREAACSWFVENLDMMEQFRPKQYPRIVKEVNGGSNPLFLATLVFGILGTLMGIVTSYLTYRQRKRQVMVYSQVEFLYLLLAGAVMVTVGGIISAVRVSKGSCIATIWLISHGYTLLLVPLIVKVAAINSFMHAARAFRRIVLKRTHLFGAVAMIDVSMSIFLTFWTTIDPPRVTSQYELTDTSTENGESVVVVNFYCSSKHEGWLLAILAWNFLLIIIASVLAYMARNHPSDFRDTQTLAMMIYSHFLFAVLRVLSIFLGSGSGSGLNESDLRLARSLVYSFDVMSTILIYFIPKFFASDNRRTRTQDFMSRIRLRVTRGSVPRIQAPPAAPVDTTNTAATSGTTANTGGTMQSSDLTNTQDAVIEPEAQEEGLNDSLAAIAEASSVRCRRCGTITRHEMLHDLLVQEAASPEQESTDDEDAEKDTGEAPEGESMAERSPLEVPRRRSSEVGARRPGLPPKGRFWSFDHAI